MTHITSPTNIIVVVFIILNTKVVTSYKMALDLV